MNGQVVPESRYATKRSVFFLCGSPCWVAPSKEGANTNSLVASNDRSVSGVSGCIIGDEPIVAPVIVIVMT